MDFVEFHGHTGQCDVMALCLTLFSIIARCGYYARHGSIRRTTWAARQQSTWKQRLYALPRISFDHSQWWCLCPVVRVVIV